MAEVVVETERLRLRTWDHRDREVFERHLNTPAVMRWLGGVQDEAAYTAAFDRIDSYQRNFGHTYWLVERKSDNALLGFCGLKRVNSPGAPFPGDFEIGWRLREDAWGQGYAGEAAAASLDFAFDRCGAPHVVAMTVDGNRSSRKLMDKLGLRRREDLDYFDCRFGPELNPSIVYRITADEWASRRS